MAQRRMFSDKIVDTDAFLDMGTGSQLLYFHLCMRADDDGFVSNPKKIMRMIGSQDDDFKVLLAKRFVIQFESGVCVIKHWLIHNLLRLDRYHETQYVKEKKMLVIDEETKKYSLIKPIETICQPDGNQMAPQVRLGKVRIGKDINTSKSKDLRIPEVIKLFEVVNPSYETLFKNKTERSACERLLKKWTIEQIQAVVNILPDFNANQFSKGKSITPYQLEKNLGFIKAFIDQKKNNSHKVVSI